MDFAGKLEKSVVMDSEEPVSKGMSEIAKNDLCVVIMKEGVYHGIVDERSLEKLSADPLSTKLETISEKAPLIPPNASLLDMAKYFFAGPYKTLPLGTKENIEGVLKRNEVLSALLSSANLSGEVKDFMTTPPVTIDEGASVANAKAKMRESRVRRLIVTRNGELAGLLSVYDIISSAKPKEKAPFLKQKVALDEHPIKSFMVSSEDVKRVSPGSSLSTAAKAMVEAGVASLVVMDNSKPLGLLSARDIFESVIRQEKTPVYLSGLSETDKMYVQEILDEANAELEKLGKSFEISYLSMHFKKYKHKYSIHARLKTSKHGIILAKNDGFELQGTVHGVLSELKKMLMGKMKANPIHDRRN